MSIKVMCRVRPPLDVDTGEQIITTDGNKIIIQHEKQTQNFQFERAFGCDATQQQLFESTIPLLDSVLQGLNGTIFSYGATCAGKTYSISGPDFFTDCRGIIPRSIEYIFSQIESIQNSTATRFRVSISFLEIYLEKVRDLLAPAAKQNLQVLDGDIAVPDATEIQVGGFDEVQDILVKANQFKVMAPNKINQQSSRSHCILQINILSREQNSNRFKLSKLFLADLAGSEKIQKTESVGLRLDEAKQINKSLLALGKVVFSLTENATYIPYRDSKLTRLLKCSLGGNSNTLLLVHVSPSSDSLMESLSTLLFASRARSVKNEVRMNEFNDDLQMQKAVQLLILDRNVIQSLADKQQIPAQILNFYLQNANDSDYITSVLSGKIVNAKQFGKLEPHYSFEDECATPSMIADDFDFHALNQNPSTEKRQQQCSGNIVNGDQLISQKELLQLKQDQALLYELTGKPEPTYCELHDVQGKVSECDTVFQIIRSKNQLLLQERLDQFDLEAFGSDGLPPLSYALKTGNIQAAAQLLAAGADPLLKDQKDDLPIHLLLDNLCYFKTPESQQLVFSVLESIIAETNPIFDYPDHKNRFPLQILIQAQGVQQEFRIQLLSLLINKKFDLYIDTPNLKWYCVMDCVYVNDELSLSILLQFIIDQCNNSPQDLEVLGVFRAFHLSIKLGYNQLIAAFSHFEAIRDILINCQFMNQTALELSFMVQNISAFDYLLKKGATIDQQLLDKLFNNNSIAYIEAALPYCYSTINFNQPMAAAISFGSVQLFQLIIRMAPFKLDQKIAAMCRRVHGENSEFYKLVKCFISGEQDLQFVFESWLYNSQEFRNVPLKFKSQTLLLESPLDQAGVYLIEYLYKVDVPFQVAKAFLLQLSGNSVSQLGRILRKQKLQRLLQVAKIQKRAEWARFLIDYVDK